MFSPPPTDFPPDSEPLSREELNSVYLKLRNCYRSSMRSRGQHRSLASKAREETAQLRQRLLDLAQREASVRIHPPRGRPMGQLTDSLRATLRELAQSDARLYRGLQEELGDSPKPIPRPPTLPHGEARASCEELEALSIQALWELCKQRGIKGLSRGPMEQQMDALLRHPDGPPLRSALPSQPSRGGTRGRRAPVAAPGRTPEPLPLEQRLERLEQLVLLIARQVGVPAEAIAQLGPEARPGSGEPPA
ncbi:MAG: hypothetical protein ACKO5F_00140 [Synechococcus sp.]